MIYRTLENKYQLEQAFREMNRLDQFTRYDLLFNYLNDENNTELGYKLDVIEICVYFNEFESLEDFNKQYNKNYKTIKEIELDYLVLCDDQAKFIVEAF
jgi:hypothetical protein